MIRTVHVSTRDVSGGAAIAAYRLHKSFAPDRCASSMFVMNQRQHLDDSVIQFRPSEDLPRRVSRKLKKMYLGLSRELYMANRPDGLEKFTDERDGYLEEFVAALPSSDILHFHWVSDFIRLAQVVESVAGKVPIVFTLHDMNLFTGGCHYDLECGKFASQCGRCPQLGSRSESDRAFKNFKLKQKVYSRLSENDIRIVCPSQWLAREAARSKTVGHLPIEVIANGIDLSVFRHRDQSAARKVFEIADDAKVLLFISDATGNQRKGLHHLLAALEQLENKGKLMLLTVGGGLPEDFPALPHVHLGSVNSESLMASVYSAADIFVAPYQQDNLPNTIIESMACETPVVAFDIGGIPEILTDGVSGVLVRDKSAKGLSEVLDGLLNSDQELLRLSGACRAEVKRKFDGPAQATKYLQLYESLLTGRAGA